MKTLKIRLVIAILAGGTNFYAQTPQHDALMNDFHYVQGQIRPTGEEDLGAILGTPYFKESFQPSLLYFSDSKPIEAQVRYNVVKEEMQALFDAANFRVLHDGIVVETGGIPFQKFSYRAEDKGVDLLGYFEILTPDYREKDLILIRKPVKEVKEGKKTLRMQMAFSAKYVEKSELYLKFKNTVRAVQVENSVKKFLEAFPKEHREKVKAFIKSNDYKTKNEADLAAIVEYYNANS